MRRFFTNNKPFLAILSFVAVLFVIPGVTHAGFLDGMLTSGDFIGKILGSFFEVFLLPLASFVFALSGLLFDTAVNFSLHTAYIFSLSPAINLGWVIVRDICNIFFIFILIYISLGTIIQGSGFHTKDLLTKVIIAALVINFSLFFTKVAIDASNVFGLWLYGGIMKTAEYNAVNPAKASLSDLISTRLGIIQWWQGGNNTTANKSEAGAGILSSPSSGFFTSVLRLVIVLIATYIFCYTSILFIARSVTLLFLMVFSPIGFMGDVLPQLKDPAADWKKELTKAAMFPLSFLLMLYIALQFINSLKFLDWKALDDKSFGGVSISIYFQYFLIIFLLQECLTIAKDNSGKMGKMVEGFASGLGKFAVGATTSIATGGTAFVGRRVIGAAASSFSENGRLNDMAAGKVGGNAFTKFSSQVLGKATLGAARNTAKASFDARNVKAVGEAAKGFGIELGKAGGKDGYKGMVKDREDMEKKFAESFGDDKAGIERRLAYAENRKRSAFTWLAVGDKREKIGGGIRSDAGLAAVKSETNDTQKALTEAKNKIVEETMAREMLNKATKSGDINDIDSILNREIERAKLLRENSQKDKKNAIPYNRYNYLKAEEAGNLDEMSRLDAEFKEATKDMLDAERRKFFDIEKNDQVQEIKTLEEFVDTYSSEVKKALKDSSLETKKLKIDAIQDIIKNRIGEASSDWKPEEKIYDETGKEVGKGKFGKEGKGLAETLRKKQVEIKEKRREQAIMEGKDPGKKSKNTPGVVKKSEPPEADEGDE